MTPLRLDAHLSKRRLQIVAPRFANGRRRESDDRSTAGLEESKPQ
jgi:hypothetical protein